MVGRLGVCDVELDKGKEKVWWWGKYLRYVLAVSRQWIDRRV